MTPPPVETAVVDSFEPTFEGGTSQIGLLLILILPTIGGVYVAYGQGASAESVAMNDHRRSRSIRAAGQHDTSAVIRPSGHHGG